MITMLVVKYLRLLSTFGWSPFSLVALWRQELFVYRDLFTRLNDSSQAPLALAGLEEQQLALSFVQSRLGNR